MNLILHITRLEQWEQAKKVGSYEGDTLHTEGFIHTSTNQQVVKVADARFRGHHGLILLCIDADKVTPEIKYEDGGNGELFPHIYGPLNTDAVVEVLGFEPGADGYFSLPEKLK